MVSCRDKPKNHPIYAVDTDLGSSICFNDGPQTNPEIPIQIEFKEYEEFSKRQETLEKKHNEEGLWTMYFDGSISKIGAGAGVFIIYPNRDFKALSYKLNFECTNNMIEYESLLLGLNALKEMGAKRIEVFGDSELVLNQVNGNYQTKHPRMMAYINEVWDIFGNYFTEHKFRVIPRRENGVVDSLAKIDSKFKTLLYSRKKYKVEVVNRPSIPDNSKYWHVFLL